MSVTGCIGEVLAHNTPADNGQIVYDEKGMIVRSAFGRPLSVLETELCNALDNIHVLTRKGYYFHSARDDEERQPRTMGHGI